MMKFDQEPYERLLIWTTAFAILQPLTAFMDHFLYKKYGMKGTFQLYSKISPFLVVVCEYTYMTIVFVKTMYIYKNWLKKPGYYPRKGNFQDYRDFILLFMAILVIIDILWAITIQIVTSQMPFLKFLDNYNVEIGVTSLLRPILFGIGLFLISDVALYHMQDLEAIGTILFGIFIAAVASF